MGWLGDFLSESWPIVGALAIAVAIAHFENALHAADRDQLQAIYTELDRIDTREVETATYRPRIDLFHWPLAVFLVLGWLYHIGLLVRRAISRRQAAHG